MVGRGAGLAEREAGEEGGDGGDREGFGGEEGIEGGGVDEGVVAVGGVAEWSGVEEAEGGGGVLLLPDDLHEATRSQHTRPLADGRRHGWDAG